MPDFRIEKEHRGVVAGIDEVGRGPWAGPVIAAAVILPRNICHELMNDLDDSKKLSRAQREALHKMVSRCADIGIGCASVAEIEKNNILVASHIAMVRAVTRLPKMPNIALIDGKHIPEDLPCTGRAVIRGDSVSLSIAAASIVAKVTRDRIMASLALRYPAFGWERNSGYGTREHQNGLSLAGVTLHHRRTYAPIAKILGLHHK